MSFVPRLLRTERDCSGCRDEIARLASLEPTPARARRIELLEKLLEIHQAENLRALAAGDAIDAVLVRMRERGLRQADIAPWVGGRNRASEILSRKRPLSLAMIEALARELHIPVELLLPQPRGRGAE
jgi:HTH-type transcriptional regulator/antitoxin HigA